MLPKNLIYQKKVHGAPARSYRANIRPTTGGTFGLGDTIEFDIPTKANLVMVPTENYLRFDVAITNSSGAASTYRLDTCGWHGLIQRIRGWHGSNNLEDTNNYGQLAKMLYDLQMSDDNIKGKQTLLTGTRSDTVTTYTTGATFSASTTSILSSRTVNSGGLISASLANAGTSTVQSPCLNLISMFGSLCNQVYFPLFACSSNSLRLEIQLADAIQKFCCCTSGTGTITVTNVEFVCNMIELSDDAITTIKQSLQDMPLQFVMNSIRNFATSIAVTNTAAYTNTFTINAKYASIKSILVSRRDQNLGTATYFPFSSSKVGLQQYQFAVGSIVLPPKAPTKISEMFAELIKTTGSISDVLYTPAIGVDDYNVDLSVASVIATDPNYATVGSNAFYIGLDLENFPNAPKDSIFSGWNANTDTIVLQEQGTATITGTLRYDAYAIIDQVFVFDKDTCFVKN
jgi:hypothetical protein